MPATWSDRTWFACYLALSCIVATMLAQLNWLGYRKLSSHGITTTAHVLRPTCGMHQTFSFEFVVKGRVISGSGRAGYGNPACEELKPGDVISVTYLPEDPGRNATGKVSDRLMNETATIGAAALAMPALVVLRLRQVARGKREKARAA